MKAPSWRRSLPPHAGSSHLIVSNRSLCNFSAALFAVLNDLLLIKTTTAATSPPKLAHLADASAARLTRWKADWSALTDPPLLSSGTSAARTGRRRSAG